MVREYFVYILANSSHELYVGITGNLARRIAQHRTRLKADGYTARHEMTQLVYCEGTADVLSAIRREKQIKGWTRMRKLELIEKMNPEWKDLAEGW
jgi:putative endonuclease